MVPELEPKTPFLHRHNHRMYVVPLQKKNSRTHRKFCLLVKFLGIFPGVDKKQLFISRLASPVLFDPPLVYPEPNSFVRVVL